MSNPQGGGRPRRRAWPVWAGLALLLVLATFVSIRHAPFYLPDIGPPAMAEVEGKVGVFGYATLSNPVVRLIVVGRVVPASPARLEGFRREGRMLVPDSDAVVDGRLFKVGSDGLHRLDRYERLGERYERLTMTLADGTEAQVYMRLH